MQLELHPSAAERIDELANAARAGIESGTLRFQEPKWAPDRPVTTIGRDKLVGPIRMRLDGPKPYYYMHGEQGGRIVRGEAAKQLQAAIRQLVKAARPSGAVSVEAVRNLAEKWVFDESIAQPFSEYAVSHLKTQIRSLTVSLPIANLAVQSSVPVGKVQFCPVTPECLERWYNSNAYAALDPHVKEMVDEHRADVEKKLRGTTAGVVEILAEPLAARDLALSLVRTALNVLTFFAPELINPGNHNHCALSGQENIERQWVFIVADGKIVREYHGLVHEFHTLLLDNARIQDMRSNGLDRLSNILAAEDRSDYQSRVLASITLYAEASRERRFTSRLVLILSALEGMFLKNDNEPIQQNLGERIAMLIEESAEKRIEILKLVRRVYARRSRFVHHSEHVELDPEFEQFTELGWLALQAAIDNIDRFDTQQQFVESIDFRKMGGASPR